MPDIDFQRIELNIIPKQGEQPVVFYASQYETTRPFIADLMWGDSEFAPGPDCWAEIDIRKNDDNLVVITEDVAIDNNEVSVILPVQALTCIGKNIGQVKIYAGEDQLIAALNFILEVQPDPLSGGVTSDTAIDNLESQIAAIVPEVVGEDYYDKTEVDALLADKADVSDLPDMTDYYTKSQVYNKTETDALLADKADVSDIPDMNNYYTKSQIDNNLINNYATYTYLGIHYYNKASVENLISDAVTLRGEAEGAIATFNTALEELPDTLHCYFDVPGGITELNVTNCGVNVWNEEWEVGTYQLNTINSKNPIYVIAGKTYYFHCVDGGTIYEFTSNGTNTKATVMPTSGTITMRSDTAYVKFYINASYGTTYNDDVSLNSNADFTDYAPYTAETITIDLDGTYTEGYVDPLNGKLYDTSVTPAVEHSIIRKWIYQAEGVNNFFSDGNDKTYVKYKDTIQHYIDTRL